MIPNGIVECFFDPANSYKLSVNAKMPSIERENVFDDRQITLIDYDTFVAGVASAEAEPRNMYLFCQYSPSIPG